MVKYRCEKYNGRAKCKASKTIVAGVDSKIRGHFVSHPFNVTSPEFQKWVTVQCGESGKNTLLETDNFDRIPEMSSIVILCCSWGVLW